MLLPIFQAECREDPCCPWEIWSHGCYQIEVAPAVELLQPTVAVGRDTVFRQQLLPDSAANPEPAEPAMAACGFLCSLQQVFECSIGCMLSAWAGRS